MKTSFMFISKIAASFFLILFLSSISSRAYDKDEIQEILRNYINYWYSDVTLYKFTGPAADDIKRSLNPPEAAAKAKSGGAGANCEEYMVEGSTFYPVYNDYCKCNKDPNKTEKDCKEEILKKYFDTYEEIWECVQISCPKGTGVENIFHAYLITTPKKVGKDPEIIGLVVKDVTPPKPGEEKTDREILSNITANNVYSFRELDTLMVPSLDKSGGKQLLLEILRNLLIQNENEPNVRIRISDPQRISPANTKFKLTAEKTAKSLIESEGNVTSMDIQKFFRVSNGQPYEYKAKQNELYLTEDVIRWTHYNQVYEKNIKGEIRLDSNGNKIVVEDIPTNANLPKYGVEVRYGIDDIGYPSLWSERLTISALYKNVKLGVIAPWTGWSKLSSQWYHQERKFTRAEGVGIAGEFNFNTNLAPESGVFKVGFAYVTNDAVKSNHQTEVNGVDSDFLIRANAQCHYTFGVEADQDNWLRIGVGATAYEIERWIEKVELDENREPVKKMEEMSDFDGFIGGLSAEIEFLAKNRTTPFGGGLQYFDEALSLNAWMQVPIVDNALFGRLGARAFYSAFREPYDWENESVFIATVGVIYLF